MPLPRRDPSVRHVIDGVELRSYTTGSSRSERTFVLIHGIGMSHHTFSRLAVHLREHGRVIAVDLAGFGSNRTPEQRVGIADHARFVAHVLADRGVESAVVVGHSMGSQVAVELTARSPDLVDGVVLIGPVVDPQRPTALQQGLALARDTLGEPVPVDLLVFADYVRGGLRWYLRQLPEMLHYPIQRRLEAVTRPVLVVRGHDDPVGTRDWCERLVAHASDGRLLEMGSSRHVVPRTEAEPLARALVRFAAGLGAAR
ncbi:alpha/beta fold hydrolase [Rathayibacter sp. VKM Ac-2803]|uniref:alpha/beta fold hydrolase n=1 Tax=unclassified Rathayibacter TaxID=2609250 RepID=UPI00135AC3DA|nr:MULTISPECIES: alpha/beta fold hydrolase [unclassified Rathayibacter]MWV48392.1 alpha/beta fold hydrolase [Rathayibacter sp. VKM Ac-2803]MWV59116.1 alpha/beta fold hydrolase [Rathayibacter sp. VKM Ac-2754]